MPDQDDTDLAQRLLSENKTLKEINDQLRFMYCRLLRRLFARGSWIEANSTDVGETSRVRSDLMRSTANIE